MLEEGNAIDRVRNRKVKIYRHRLERGILKFGELHVDAVLWSFV